VLAHADEARQLAGQPQQQIDAEALHGLVTRSAQERGLSIERVDSDATGVQVNLAPAPFANLLAWLQQLQAEGVSFADVSLERGDNGRVLARLSLAANG
jgi:general secretion pathway protein M